MQKEQKKYIAVFLIVVAIILLVRGAVLINRIQINIDYIEQYNESIDEAVISKVFQAERQNAEMTQFKNQFYICFSVAAILLIAGLTIYPKKS